MKLSGRGIHTNMLASVATATFVFLLLLFAGFKGNISGYYRIGSVKISPLLPRDNLIIHEGPHGCDGQQFLTLALDPLLLNPHTKDALDNPKYRAKRIMYPVLGYISGAGTPSLILFSLVIINFLSLLFLILIASLWLRHHGRSEIWALMVLAIPPVWIILSLSTAEIVCATFSLAALYCFGKKSVLLTVLFLTLAIFTRETAILLFAVLLAFSVARKKFRVAILLFIPIVLYGLWNLYISRILPDTQSFRISDHFSVPFQGIVQKISYFAHAGKPDLEFFFDLGAFALLLLVVIAGIIMAIRNYRVFPELSVLFLLQVALFFMFTNSILNKFGDYTRVCLEIYLYCFLMIPWEQKIVKYSIPFASALLSIGYIAGFLLRS